jgi:hypothetical protein
MESLRQLGVPIQKLIQLFSLVTHINSGLSTYYQVI